MAFEELALMGVIPEKWYDFLINCGNRSRLGCIRRSVILAMGWVQWMDRNDTQDKDLEKEELIWEES